MAKLPARLKVTLLCYRRADPDELLVVQREVRRVQQWVMPSVEAEPGESARDAALRHVAQLAGAPPLGDIDLRVEASYRVKDGPHAGDWTERFHAVEVAPGVGTRQGSWLPHYEAKALAGASAPRVREAVSRLRELARLRP